LVYGTVPAIAGLFYGIKPAVVAIVLFAAYRIGSRALKNQVLWAIAGLAFIAIFVLHLPFPLIVLSAALIGHFGGRNAPQYFKVGCVDGGVKKHGGPALIDDETPTPAHARFSWKKSFKVALVGCGIWVAGMMVLIGIYGWHGAFTQMGWFFTKAALMTFGGAYAVLPYVFQGAVEHYQWLTPEQMIDGLALGETTPGPLIMVVTFVGFVGGWVTQVLGVDAVFASAVAAASIVTFFTFLPSFVFIFIGAPFIESTHGNLELTAPLSAITAAVVGVILNLALFFAYHVFWPAGLEADIDWFAVALTVLAIATVFRLKLNVIPVILLCGGLGMAFKLLI
jgi:chromate transporter